MARACTVCAHADRHAIERAMLDGLSNRAIASQFRVGKDAAGNHRQHHLPQVLAESEAIPPVATAPRQSRRNPASAAGYAAEKLAAERTHAIDLTTELARYRDRAQKLSDAIDGWLSDPDEPSRYDIGPRSTEITVVYEDLADVSPTGQPKRKRENLAVLLERVEAGGVSVQRVESKHADPRKLHLDTLAEMRQQLALLVTIAEKLQNAQQVATFEQAVLDAIGEVAPDVRVRILDTLRRRQPLRRLVGAPPV